MSGGWWIALLLTLNALILWLCLDAVTRIEELKRKLEERKRMQAEEFLEQFK